MALITLSFVYTPGQTLPAASLNADLQTIYNDYNGNINNANLATNAGIVLSKLQLNPGAIAFDQQATGNICWAAGLTSDTDPSVGFTSDGWAFFGPGVATPFDVYLKRSAALTLQLNSTTGSPVLDMNGGTIINVTLPPATPTPQLANFGRIYGTTGEPFGDTSTSGTVFFGPTEYGNRIVIEDPTSHLLVTQQFVEASIAVSTLTAGMNDIYVSSLTSTTVAVTSAPWTNATTPPTRSTDVMGRYTANGNVGALLVGAVYVNGGAITDYLGSRCISNLFNLIEKSMLARITSDWTYNPITVRSSDANTTIGQGRFEFCQVSAINSIEAFFSDISFGAYCSGLALDNTTALDICASTVVTGTSDTAVTLSNSIIYPPQIGYHYIQHLESGQNNSQTVLGYGSTNGLLSSNGFPPSTTNMAATIGGTIWN